LGKLYEQLRQYGESDIYPYHMPGHKRNTWGQLSEEIVKIDITEIDGFDNLHQAEGILRELQEKAAHMYGAEESFYLINGSTCGILTAISAALPQGGHILMARNCHKSAYHAAYLRNLTISYLYPALVKGYDICEAITAEQVKEALAQVPDIGAVLLVSPTYEGRIADIRAIAEVVHEKGVALIVDEAHGAHLGLTQGQYPNSCQQGADLVIHSVHKTLHAMTQTALLHVNGRLINRDKLRRFLHIYQSSSPSYVLMASIDNALEVMEQQGQVLWDNQKKYYLEMLDELKKCQYLSFVPMDEKQDIGKLVISSKKTGLSGLQIYDMLLKEYHLQLEMAAGSYCLAMFTLGDTPEAYERMTRALLAIDGEIAEEKPECATIPDTKVAIGSEQAITVQEKTDQMVLKVQPEVADFERKKVTSEQNVEELRSIPLAQAWDMGYELVPLQEAVGKYVGDFINLYPPGVPLLVPGEVMLPDQEEILEQYLRQGLQVQGLGADAPHLVKVLRDLP